MRRIHAYMMSCRRSAITVSSRDRQGVSHRRSISHGDIYVDCVQYVQALHLYGMVYIFCLWYIRLVSVPLYMYISSHCPRSRAHHHYLLPAPLTIPSKFFDIVAYRLEQDCSSERLTTIDSLLQPSQHSLQSPAS
jgi:hypothetical protein